MIVWHISRADEGGGWELVGWRKTRAGAETLAERTLGRVIHGWFMRGQAYGEPILHTMGGEIKLERAWAPSS